MKASHFVRSISVLSVLLVSAFGQTNSAPAPASSDQIQSGPPQSPTFHSNTRLVTLEIVARDKHGQSVPGLTADDFQIMEQIGSKHDQHPQKVASFRAVQVAEIAALDKGMPQLPPGVYTNLLTLNQHPVPPTILLIDGLNTDRSSQMQVHRQAIRMLASLPADVPAAVFLLGQDLKMIQDFTTDPQVLKTALQKAQTPASSDQTDKDPQDDPDAMSAFMEDIPTLPSGMLSALEGFEREVYAVQMDDRVRETLDALRALARHVAGYPGRKNLLWISSSFPIAIDPDVNLGWSGFRNYQDQMAEVVAALADAKIAVYPMDPAGLQTQSMFQASSRMRQAGNPQRMGAQLEREDQARDSRRESMEVLADETGGIVCANNNDLGDCVHKAMNDGSSFYEIAYYPDSGNWSGEFHKIIVRTGKPGIHLAYRKGYYAQQQISADQKAADRALQEAACRDLLTSTSLLMMAKQYPVDQPGKAKYFMAIDPSMLSFASENDGSRELAIKIGVCTFDKSARPLQFWTEALNPKLTDKQYAAVVSQHGFPHSIIVAPAPQVAAVRLLVQDQVTGRMGSVNVPYKEMVATATAPPTPSAAPAVPTTH